MAVCADSPRKWLRSRYNFSMMIEFRVENHRSIRDEQVLSMDAATEKGDKEEVAAGGVHLRGECEREEQRIVGAGLDARSSNVFEPELGAKIESPVRSVCMGFEKE